MKKKSEIQLIATDYSPKILKNKNLFYLGYGYEFQEVNYMPSESFDMRCNAIITDKSIKVFKL